MGADQNLDWNGLTASTLDWWREAGVDMLVDEAPRNWLAAPAPALPPPDVAAAMPGAVAAALPTPAGHPATALPNDLAAFEAWRVGPDAPEARWPGRPLPPVGVAGAELLVLIDQPEREDAESGQLLGGAAGRLFDAMLAAIGRSRDTIYLASLAVVRPATGRLTREAAAELAVLTRHHIGLVAPRRVLMLGDAASRAILAMGVHEAGGGLHAINLENAQEGVNPQALASFHPRFLLERPACKAEAWRDLQTVIGDLGA